MKRIKIACAIVPSEYLPRCQILHRQTKRVKSQDDAIVNTKLVNGDKIFDEGRRNKNIAEKKIAERGRDVRVTGAGNRYGGTITNGDRRKNRRKAS